MAEGTWEPVPSDRETESPEARMAREYEAWEMSDAGIAAQDAAIARVEQREPSRAGQAGTPLLIDTSEPDLGPRWQEQLAALDARLEHLLQREEAQQQMGMER
jgi:hypothetical protein